MISPAMRLLGVMTLCHVTTTYNLGILQLGVEATVALHAKID